jgi:predicted transposase YdaD
MKTDKWFYELFLSQPGMMAELVPGIEPEWEFVYSAPVVKKKEFRLDGVFMPVSEDPLVPIIFAEAQMQTDEQFYGRYFAQLFVHLYQYRVSRDWRGLMILQSREQRLGNDLPYRELLAQRVTRLYLSDLRTEEALSPNLTLLHLLVADKNKTLELSKGLSEKWV